MWCTAATNKLNGFHSTVFLATLLACLLLHSNDSSIVNSPSASSKYATWSYRGQSACANSTRDVWIRRRRPCSVALQAIRGGTGSDFIREIRSDEIGGARLNQRSDRGKRAEEARRHRDEGDQLYKRGSYGKAIEAYTAALVADCSVEGAFGGRAAALLMKAQFGAVLHDALRALDAADAAMNTRTGTLIEAAAANIGAHLVARMHAHLLLAKTLLALGRGEEACLHYKNVTELGETRSADIDMDRRATLECLHQAREGMKHARTYETLIRRCFTNLHQTRDMFYLPIVGRWRSWRTKSSSSSKHVHLLPLGADDVDVTRNRRLSVLVSDTLKLCGRAETLLVLLAGRASTQFTCFTSTTVQILTQKRLLALLAPAAPEALVLTIWAHLVAGNTTAALALCSVEQLLEGTGARAAGGAGGRGGAGAGAERGGERGGEGGQRGSGGKGEARGADTYSCSPVLAYAPESPEIWVLCGRALHLCGRVADAKRVLTAGMARKLEARAACGLAEPVLASLPASERVQSSQMPRLSSRDVERLLRECRYEVSLVDKLAASLESAARLTADPVYLHPAAKLDRLIQELTEAMHLDSNNLFFAAQALCLIAEAKSRQAKHTSAIADAQRALTCTARLLALAAHAPALLERPYVVLGECSRSLGLYDAALTNLTRAAALAPAERAAHVGALLLALRREKDAADHTRLGRDFGFAGFRGNSFDDSRRAAQDAAGAGSDDAERQGAGREHPAFAEARSAYSGGREKASRAGAWNYDSWNKARWDEEYRAAYERFAKDKEDFGFGGRGSAHKFPWERAEADAEAERRRTAAAAADPFAPPGGHSGYQAKYRPTAAGAAGGGDGEKRGAANTGAGVSSRGLGMYSMLQVPVTATAPEIKKAYMKQALIYHPDKYTGPDKAGAEERFKNIVRAYETLTDVRTRREHDEAIGLGGEKLNMNAAFSYRA